MNSVFVKERDECNRLALEHAALWVKEGSYPCIIPNDCKPLPVHVVEVMSAVHLPQHVRVAAIFYLDNVSDQSATLLQVQDGVRRLSTDSDTPRCLRYLCLRLGFLLDLFPESELREMLLSPGDERNEWVHELIATQNPVLFAEVCATLLRKLSDTTNILGLAAALHCLDLHLLLPESDRITALLPLLSLQSLPGIVQQWLTEHFLQSIRLLQKRKRNTEVSASNTSTFLDPMLVALIDYLSQAGRDAKAKWYAFLALRDAGQSLRSHHSALVPVISSGLASDDGLCDDICCEIVVNHSVNDLYPALVDLAQDASRYEYSRFGAIRALSRLDDARSRAALFSLATNPSECPEVRSLATRSASRFTPLMTECERRLFFSLVEDETISWQARTSVAAAISDEYFLEAEVTLLHYAALRDDNIDAHNFRIVVRHAVARASADSVFLLAGFASDESRDTSDRISAFEVLVRYNRVDSTTLTMILQPNQRTNDFLRELLSRRDLCAAIEKHICELSETCRKVLLPPLLHRIAYYCPLHHGHAETLHAAYRLARTALVNAQHDDFRLKLVELVGARGVIWRESGCKQMLQALLFHPHFVKSSHARLQAFWRHQVDKAASVVDAIGEMVPDLAEAIYDNPPFGQSLTSEENLEVAFNRCIRQILHRVAKRAQRRRCLTTSKSISVRMSSDVVADFPTGNGCDNAAMLDVQEALGQLDESVREIFLRVRVEESEQKQLAREMGISERTVRRKLGEASFILSRLLCEYQ